MKYILLILLFSIACNDNCKDDIYRCNGDIEEICVDGDWITNTDCSKIFTINKNQIITCCESSDFYDGGPGCDLPENCKE